MKLFLIVLVLSIITGCSSDDFVGSPKFESALNLKLKKMINENNENSIGIILLSEKEPGTAELSKLEDTGLKIGSVTGNIITATGTPKSIIKAGKFSFVKQIQLAKNNYLKQ